MVNDENYEQAKSVAFGNEINTTYKTLVKKIDNYHYNIQNKLDSTLKAMAADGVKINIICKYGRNKQKVFMALYQQSQTQRHCKIHITR